MSGSRWSSALYARVVGSVVLIVLLWPIAHRQLVLRYDVNPWKLFGFAMYCTPHEQSIRFYGERDGRREIIPPRSMPKELHERASRFASERLTLGKFHEPHELARFALTELPGADAIVIEVTIARLEPGGTRLEPKARLYRYARK